MRDLLVKADCRLPKTPVKPTQEQSQARIQFLQGTTPTATPPSKTRTIQSTLLDFFQPGRDQQPNLIASTSASQLAAPRENIARRSTSLTSVTRPNLLRNKCIAKKACTYCPLLNKSGSIKCHVTGKTFHSKKNITCRSSNLVYCITCKTCGIQYVGQTKRTILERFQGHCGNITTYQKRREEEPQLFRKLDKDAVGTHFSAPNHNGIQDLIISVLAFITIPPMSKASLVYRLKVEKEWIHRMRCPAPEGLNIFD